MKDKITDHMAYWPRRSESFREKRRLPLFLWLFLK